LGRLISGREVRDKLVERLLHLLEGFVLLLLDDDDFCIERACDADIELICDGEVGGREEALDDDDVMLSQELVDILEYF